MREAARPYVKKGTEDLIDMKLVHEVMSPVDGITTDSRPKHGPNKDFNALTKRYCITTCPWKVCLDIGHMSVFII